MKISAAADRISGFCLTRRRRGEGEGAYSAATIEPVLPHKKKLNQSNDKSDSIFDLGIIKAFNPHAIETAGCNR